MPKTWSATCGENNQCWGAQPTSWCEKIGDDCFCGDLGDLGIADIQPDKFQETMDASTTKFYGTRTKNGGLQLQEVGMLAAAGLQVGDELLGVTPLVRDAVQLSMSQDRAAVLQWQIATKGVYVVYERDDDIRIGYMSNPAYKGES